jgi:hypothetical protein
MPGQIVDAILVAAPRQRNANDENKASKKCGIPDGWKDKPAKLRGFVARMCRTSLGVLNGIDEGQFQPGVLSCLSNIIPRDAVTFPGKGIE